MHRSKSSTESGRKNPAKRAESAGLRWPLEEGLFGLLFPDACHPAQPCKTPLPDWPWIHAELRKKGVTLRLLWREYREGQPDGYGYSQFCQLYRQWSKRLRPCMRLAHRAGEKLFTDYTGQTIPLTNPDSGGVKEAYIFVPSSAPATTLTPRPRPPPGLANWIGAHVRTFEFLGGVPDNLKTGVKHPGRYEPDLNPTYQELAQHYGCAVIPARVCRPRDKAKVRVAVQLGECWIIASLRHHLNAIILGATGASKTFLACALGQATCRQGLSGRYERTSHLLQALRLAQADGSYAKLLDGLAPVQLLILDDWLRDPLTVGQARGLLEILDDRYGRTSTLVATQVPVDTWLSQLPDPTLADAIPDRLVHNAYRLDLRGESQRKARSPLAMPTT